MLKTARNIAIIKNCEKWGENTTKKSCKIKINASNTEIIIKKIPIIKKVKKTMQKSNAK